LSSWKFPSAFTTAVMFRGASSFNQDISSWDVSSVGNMQGMFHGASLFDQDISSWDVSSVTNMKWLVYEASSFNQDLCPWTSLLPSNALVFNPFARTSCPTIITRPSLSSDPKGPFCHVCT